MKILVSFAIILFTIFVIWRANRQHSVGGKSAPSPATSPPPSTTGFGASPSEQAGGWKKLGWLLVTCSAIGITVTGIYWGVQKINQDMPEKKEFTGYYRYQVGTREGDPILVKVTPNAIGAGYADRDDGASVTLRWTRGGEGVWRKFKTHHTSGSWMKVTNVTENPEADFNEWQHTIIGELGDDENPSKSVRVSLTR